MDTLSSFIQKQRSGSVAAYQARVYRLAGIYMGLVIIALITDLWILVDGQLFVNLNARWNVKSLILTIMLLGFTYLLLVSLPGAWGALKILFYNWPAWVGHNRHAIEIRKQAALKPPTQRNDNAVYLNCLVHRTATSCMVPVSPIEIPLADESGHLGMLVIDGVKMTIAGDMGYPAPSLFAYFVHRIQALVQARNPKARVEIVQWMYINAKAALQYESLVIFLCNLAKRLDAGPLWPLVELSEHDLETLESEGRALCPVLRDEAHLPSLGISAGLFRKS